MIRKIVREQTPFEKYFSEAPARKPYMKIVSAFPDGRLKGFDSNIANDELEEDLGDIELDDDDLVDDTDFSANIDDIDGEEPEQTQSSDEPVVGDDVPEPTSDAEPVVTGVEPVSDDGGLDTEPPTGDDFVPTDDAPSMNADTPQGDTPPEETNAPTDGGAEVNDDGGGGELADDPPAGDDFSANIDDDSSGDDSMTDNADTSGDGGQTAPANTIDNQLRFSLYRNMKNLYKAIQSYEERLGELVSPSYNFNITSKIANKKLVELEETMYQYMTVKFKDADYIVSMNFYQKCIATLMLIFELMRSNKKDPNIDKNGKLNGETFI